MRIIRRIFTVVLLGIAGLAGIAIAAWWLVDDATLVAVLERGLEAGAGVHVTYQGEAHVTRTLTPTLSVDRLLVADTQYRVETDALRVQLSLPRLLLGELDIPLLQLGDTRITLLPDVPGAEPEEKPENTTRAGFSPLMLKPVLHDVQIGSVSVLRDGGELHLPAFNIGKIKLKTEPDTESLVLAAQVGLAGEDLAIDLSLPEFYQALQRQLLSFSLSAHGARFRLDADGEIALDKTGAMVDAAIRASTVDLSNISVGADVLSIPGTLVADARLKGPVDRPALDSVTAHWNDAGDSALKLDGHIADLVGLDGIQFQLHGKLRKPVWLTTLLPESLGTLDSADLDAGVSGAYQQLAVSDFRLGANTGDGLDLTLDGQFGLTPADTGLQPANIDLKLAFAAPTTRAARILLFDQVPELGAVTGQADVRSLAAVPKLENVVIKTKDSKGIETELTGGIARFPLDPDQPNSGYDLDVVMKAASTSILASRLAVDVPLTGPATLEFHIAGDTQALSLEQIGLLAGRSDTVQLGARGQLLFGDWALPDPLVRVDLKFHATSKDSASLGKLVGQELPELGALTLNGYLHTVSGRHRVDDIRLQTREGAPVKVSLTGFVESVSLLPRVAVQGIRLRAEASAPDSAQLNSVFGLDGKIPALGPFMAQARIQDKGKLVDLESGSIRVGAAGAPAVEATGVVEDLFGSAKTRWDVKLNVEGRTLAGYAGHSDLADLGTLVGSMVIANSGGPLGIQSLAVSSAQTKAWSLAVNGQFPDFSKPGTLALTAYLTATDLQVLGKLMGREWPAIGPVAMKNAVTATRDGTGIDSNLKISDMRIDTRLGVAFDSSRPQVSGQITANEVFFPDPLVESADSSKKTDKPAAPVFSRTPLDFSWLKKIDLDLEVDIASFSQEKSNLESARFKVSQKDGLLEVSPATLVYPQGKLDLALRVDAQDPPRMSLKASGDNLDPWRTLEIQQGKTVFDTDVDIDIAVETFGNSPHDLAANAGGTVYITMKNGKIRRSLLDLVFIDFVGWTVAKTTHEKYTDIDCGVADLAVKKGVITTKAFLLDTKTITISGEGSIDLGREQIDYALLPKKKSRFITKADPVKITGELNDPSVRVIPWKSAAITYGGLVFAPYIFAGVTAANYLREMLETPKTSPCEKYETQHNARIEPSGQ